MTLYFALKIAHIVGATILFGTGMGIAFFMLMAHRSGDVAFIAHTAGIVVLADTLFTATAVVLQPLTGIGIASLSGLPLSEGWIVLSLLLYVVTGLFWLPVVWLQIRMRRLALAAVASAMPLPPGYHRLFRIWFACGFPAFFAVMAIIGLMVIKPALF